MARSAAGAAGAECDMTETKCHSGEGHCDDPACGNDCHRSSAEVIDDLSNQNSMTVEPSGIMYVYVGEGNHLTRLQREKWEGHVWGWTAATEFFAGISRGAVFGSWHEMMAYVLQRQALTPAEYQAAHEMREAI